MKIRETKPTSAAALFALLVLFTLAFSPVYAKQPDPLPSWNEGSTKTAILEFVAAVTDKNSKDYVEPAKRIATFDNDGTLWVEYPMYTQVLSHVYTGPFRNGSRERTGTEASGMENQTAL